MIRSIFSNTPRRLAAIVALGAMAAATIGAQTPAFAAPLPPTVSLHDGGDGYVNAAEASAVVIDGTYTPTDGSVTAVRATISEAADPGCSVGPAYLAPVDIPVDGTSGTWTYTFDVGTLAEGATLCARAVSFDGDYSAIGASPEQPVLDTSAPAAGTVEMVDTDGFLNAAEATTGCCVPANWTTSDLDAASASVWFRDSTAAITPGCGPWGVGPAGFGAVNGACATSMAEGAFEFLGTWSDAAGNVSGEASATLIKDTLGPVITLTDPLNGSAQGSRVNVAGTTGPAASLQVALDTVPVATATSAGDGSFSVPLTIADGLHTVTVTGGTDAAGNIGSASSSFTVDGLIPVIDNPKPLSGNPGAVPMNGTGRPGSRVELFEGNVLVGSAQVSATGSWALTAGMTSGTHTIKARGTGVGGSPISAFGPTLTFSVDAGRPTVGITTEDFALFVGEPVTIEGTATDGVAVSRVRLEYFDAVLGTKLAAVDAVCTGCGTGTATWTSSPSGLRVGLLSVQATAYDAAGNVSSTAAIRFLNVNA